ncbi:MAG: MFS transporter [Nocardioidaceae bacterium]
MTTRPWLVRAADLLPQAWRRTPRAVWLLVVARAVNRLGAFSLPFLSVVLTQRLGASVESTGALVAAFGLATVPSRLLGGHLADRFGRRTTIVVGLTASSLAQLAIAASTTMGPAAVAVVALGLAFEIYEAPSQAMVADVVDSDDRAPAYGLMAAGLALAGMVAGLLAVVLGHLDLRLLFVADAATCLACAALVRWTLPAQPLGNADWPKQAGASRSAWGDGLLIAMLVTGTGFAIVYLQLMLTLPLTLRARGLDPADVGWLFTLSAVTVVCGQPLLATRRVRGLQAPAALAVGYVLMGCGLLGYAVGETLPAYLVATVIWSLGDLVLLGRTYAVVADLAPADARGRYLAVFGLSWGVAATLAPLLGTQLLGRFGPTPTWAVFAAACGCLALAQPWVAHLIGARRQPGPSRHDVETLDVSAGLAYGVGDRGSDTLMSEPEL